MITGFIIYFSACLHTTREMPSTSESNKLHGQCWTQHIAIIEFPLIYFSTENKITFYVHHLNWNEEWNSQPFSPTSKLIRIWAKVHFFSPNFGMAIWFLLMAAIKNNSGGYCFVAVALSKQPTKTEPIEIEHLICNSDSVWVSILFLGCRLRIFCDAFS